MSEDKKYIYLVVEGEHDAKFIEKLLKLLFQMDLISNINDVDLFWKPLIPRSYPQKDGNILARVRVPYFYKNEDQSILIAVNVAGGDDSLAKTLAGSQVSLEPPEKIFAYGLILDSDLKTPQKRFDDLIKKIKEKIKEIKQQSLLDLPFTKKPGEVSADKQTRFGIYVFPDNENSGALENILLEIAETNYADLKACAKDYLKSVDQTKLTSSDLKQFKKYPNKAHLGAMASVLKPGKAIQISIQDNRWLDDNVLDLPIVKKLSDFLSELLDKPHPN